MAGDTNMGLYLVSLNTIVLLNIPMGKNIEKYLNSVLQKNSLSQKTGTHFSCVTARDLKFYDFLNDIKQIW